MVCNRTYKDAEGNAIVCAKPVTGQRLAPAEFRQKLLAVDSEGKDDAALYALDLHMKARTCLSNCL